MSFTPKTHNFLHDLSNNNNREWFDQNRQNYERYVRQPAFEFIEAIAGPLAQFAPNFQAEARKVGGSLMRVFRDTRFSADKTPYKTNIGIQFRHGLGKDVHAPGYYVHIAGEECFLGVGCWHPETDVLNKIRDFIVEKTDNWFSVLNDPLFKQHYQLAGDSLVKPPRGYNGDHPAIADIKRKDFMAIASITWADVYADNFPVKVANTFNYATPFMRFLCESLGISL